MKTPDIVETHPIIEDVMAPYQEKFGLRMNGIRSHSYRMVNFINCFAPASSREELDKYAIYAAFHDLPVLLTGDMDYLAPASELASSYLAKHGKAEWSAELTLMIHNHHRITPYHGAFARTVEAARRADWIDMTLGTLRFGIPEDFVVRMNVTFPIDTLLPSGWKRIFQYAINHPDQPLPMLRW